MDVPKFYALKYLQENNEERVGTWPRIRRSPDLSEISGEATEWFMGNMFCTVPVADVNGQTTALARIYAGQCTNANRRAMYERLQPVSATTT
ncbi:hypothetical protein [Streptomyces coeruleofuscus]|uniref:Uncharacterized protein n=1 Tax=Streptomyces coeruleofuscus TaxID=66879 RepID=A0ABN3HZV6_9ACTN